MRKRTRDQNGTKQNVQQCTKYFINGIDYILNIDDFFLRFYFLHIKKYVDKVYVHRIEMKESTTNADKQFGA